jgi:hypothetical protein
MKYLFAALATAIVALALGAGGLAATGNSQQVERLGPKYMLGTGSSQTESVAVTHAAQHFEQVAPKFVVRTGSPQASARVAYATLDAAMRAERSDTHSTPLTPNTLLVERLGPKYLPGS